MHLYKENTMLVCELCGFKEAVDQVTGRTDKGEKLFFFPNTGAGEICVCAKCAGKENNRDLV
jgi:hypothetical protein